MTERERQLRRSDRLRLGLILALCLAVALPVVVAMAASPDPGASAPVAPAASTAPDASAKPDASGKPDKASRWADRLRELGKGFGGKGFGGKGFGDRGLGGWGKGSGFGFGRGAITITAISGSNVSLKTDDGWTRTIAVTADTRITKAGVAATLADLSVGDTIRFAQKRNEDGTYAITAIVVPADKAGGEVTAIDGDTITVKGRGDATWTITVSGATTFRLGSEAAAKADVKVGSKILAQGELDGTTLQALTVHIQLTVVGGEVTKVTADAITVTTRDGSSVVIHLSATTEIWTLGKAKGTAADIKVGDKVIAAGVARANGSIDAQKVGAGKLRGLKAPKASAAPDA